MYLIHLSRNMRLPPLRNWTAVHSATQGRFRAETAHVLVIVNVLSKLNSGPSGAELTGSVGGCLGRWRLQQQQLQLLVKGPGEAVEVAPSEGEEEGVLLAEEVRGRPPRCLRQHLNKYNKNNIFTIYKIFLCNNLQLNHNNKNYKA